MKILYATLETCHSASGVVVVIDVCRAFTTAAYAFGSGAERVILAGTVEDALSLRSRFPAALLMGEVGGMPVSAFDFWNSPSQLKSADLRGKTLIQRTSAGTQGVIRSVQAESIFAGSFAVARATANAIRNMQPEMVTFVITGVRPEDARAGLEDRACGEYIAALLRGEEPRWQDYMGWEADFLAVHHINDLRTPLREQFLADLELCKAVDRFPWALPVRREENMLVMEKDFC